MPILGLIIFMLSLLNLSPFSIVFEEKIDSSWDKEIIDFYKLIINKNYKLNQKNLTENIENMKILNKIYNEARL